MRTRPPGLAAENDQLNPPRPALCPTPPRARRRPAAPSRPTSNLLSAARCRGPTNTELRARAARGTGATGPSRAGMLMRPTSGSCSWTTRTAATGSRRRAPTTFSRRRRWRRPGAAAEAAEAAAAAAAERRAGSGADAGTHARGRRCRMQATLLVICHPFRRLGCCGRVWVVFCTPCTTHCKNKRGIASVACMRMCVRACGVACVRVDRARARMRQVLHAHGGSLPPFPPTLDLSKTVQDNLLKLWGWVLVPIASCVVQRRARRRKGGSPDGWIGRHRRGREGECARTNRCDLTRRSIPKLHRSLSYTTSTGYQA